jgi:branched-chain amino acid transport system ATP-binding protein
MLKLDKVHVFYGQIEALKGISLTVETGEIVTLIGANGAGKSTTLAAISGTQKLRSGEIWFDGERIDGLSPDRIVQRGILQVPEGRRIFHRLTVEENLRMGGYTVKEAAVVERNIKQAYELFPILGERKKQPGGTLSGGEQQMLAIARALMANPKMLLLDEPSLGLAPILIEKIFDTIKKINCEGTSILLVEQNAQQALAVAHRGYVLETGKIVLEGTGAELLANAGVREAYLGV